MIEATKRTFEIHDLDICVDCVMLFANGGSDSVEPSWCPEGHDDGGTCEEAAENHAAATERNWPSTEGWALHNGSHECEWCGFEARESEDFNGDDCEGWFSHSSCDACGSRLGGTREHGIAMRETTEDQK